MNRQERRNRTEKIQKKRYNEMRNFWKKDLEKWYDFKKIAKYKNSLDGFSYHEDDWMYSGKMKKLNNIDCTTNEMLEEIDNNKRKHKDIKKYQSKIRWKYGGQ